MRFPIPTTTISDIEPPGFSRGWLSEHATQGYTKSRASGNPEAQPFATSCQRRARRHAEGYAFSSTGFGSTITGFGLGNTGTLLNHGFLTSPNLGSAT